MISTVSFSFDLTSAVPRCVITDSTDYTGLGINLVNNQAKGYGVLTFNGELIEAKNLPGDPLIDLELGQTVAYIDLPLDNNNNVANGVYSFEYSLRLANDPSSIAVAIPTTSSTFSFSGYEWMSDFFEAGDSITLTSVVSGTPNYRTVSSVSYASGSTTIGVNSPITSPPSVYYFTYDVANTQFSQTYAYSGCTQTTADVDFIYDCEYGTSGTWSVSNATALGSNEIVTSLSCTINYPSWTTADPAFNPQVVTTVLPYPTYPSPTPPVTTPLATGTYSVSLAEQIQQTQDSGLVIIYNKSVIKEFAVSCAGSLCGLAPCIESLRVAHATELVRNRISKYQVFVDNVALYYIEAMNYKSCGELDRYRDTVNLIQAQLDASGCDCACCDDQSYYWVSNNSANSIIEELLANFQYRLYVGGGSDPGDTQPGVEYGAIWQDTDTGILYRCINDAPGGLQWELYYDPSVVPLTGADNGLSVSGNDAVLGGSLNTDTTIDLNSYDLTFSAGNVLFSGTGSQKVTLTSTSNALQVTGGVGAVSIDGTTNALDATSTTNTAARLTVNTTTNNAAATNLSLRTTVDGGSGDDGVGSSIQFATESSTGLPVTTASIESVLVSATSPVQANLNFKTRSDSGSTLLDRLTLNSDGSATLPSYGGGTITGTPEYSLSVDSAGNVIETTLVPKVYAAKITKTNPITYVLEEAINTTGGTLSLTYSGASTSYTLTSSNGAFTTGKTFAFCTLTVTENGAFGVFEATPSQLLLQTVSSAFPAGYDGLQNAYIKIEIYP